jgi:hypothetical protein
MIREELKFTSFWYGTVCIRQTQFNFSKVSNSFSAKFSARGGERLYGLEENCPSHKVFSEKPYAVGVNFAAWKKIPLRTRHSPQCLSTWEFTLRLRRKLPFAQGILRNVLRRRSRLCGLEENSPSHKAFSAMSFDVGVDFAAWKKIPLRTRHSSLSSYSLRYNIPIISNSWKVLTAAFL